MPSFLTACAVALVLDKFYQVPADHAYASPTGVRI
jgi:hypothetical protein